MSIGNLLTIFLYDVFMGKSTISAETSGSITTGYSGFDDFVQQNSYQYGPHFDAESLKQNPGFAHGMTDHNKAYALSVAKNLSSVDVDSVALNQTINAATVALAEQDPNDPNSGSIHYVAFVQGRNPRTYVFTENVTIDPDGSITSQMEQGRGWDTTANDEQGAYSSLVKQFADIAGSVSGSPSLIAAFEKSSGRDLAVGGVESRGGEYEVRHDGDRVAVASSSDLNKTTGIEIESSYRSNGASEITMTVFRGEGVSDQFNASASGITQMESTAPGVDSQAKYNAFSQMDPGINTLKP